MDLSDDALRKLAREVVGGIVSAEVLKERPGDCSILRIREGLSEPVILKVWRRPGWKGWVRRVTRTSPGQKEFKGLSALRKIGIKAPKPMAVFALSEASFTEAFFQEDMGECVPAAQHVKTLIESHREGELKLFLKQIVEMTLAMYAEGRIDTDHTFVNIVAVPDGAAVRLDLELSSRKRLFVRPQIAGTVLGRMIGSYAYAVQPNTERVTLFARQLVEALSPSPKVLYVAKSVANEMMEGQERECGIRTQIIFPWE